MPPVTGRLLRQRPVRRLSSSSDPILPMTTRNIVVSSRNKRQRKTRHNKRSRLVGIISVFLLIWVGLILMVDFYKTKSRRRDANVVYCADGVTEGILNDDFCDCLDDGRDEPLTSACSHLLVQQANFSCHDNPFQLVYASRIRDGIFDCHDGSDEL